ncbi:MAG: sulfate adenylyltransferase [Campylobacterota bacterium]|nr:sulfate adenylyltransferase [Campylobacterota bacterium]
MANKQIHIDKEAVTTLSMVKEGLLSPVTGLMNENEAKEVNQTGQYKGEIFPFSFILAPSGSINEEVIAQAQKGEVLDLVCEQKIIGTIVTDETFKIDIQERIKSIYGTNNPEHPGVQSTTTRLGNYAICGQYNVDFDDVKKHKQKCMETIQNSNAQNVSSIIISGKPFHRVHERLIRTTLVKSDLMVIFILKNYTDELLDYDIRYKTVQYFIEHFIPKNKVVLVPLEHTYIFAGYNELLLDSIVAKNFGCNELIIGQNHAGLGAYYDHDNLKTIADTITNIDIELMSEFVYCNECTTLVSTNACPHGSHHHIKYHSSSILDLLEMGIMPPAILMRAEISSIILSHLFPNRTEKLAKIHQDLSPSSGLLDDFESTDFYKSLMDLYQTSSLT